MDYRIVEKGAFTVFGVSFQTSSVDGRAYHEVPEFIDGCEADRTTYKIVAAGKGDERTMLNAVTYSYDSDGNFRYMLCMDLPDGGVSDEFEIVHVPARTWAVFPIEIAPGSGDSIISIWKRIYPEWFPNSGYEQDEGPLQERDYRTEHGTIVVEAWVPIRKSSRPQG